jgi:hypothetical protein
MLNIHDPAIEHLTSLIEFAKSEGWQLCDLEDGQTELQKPGLPPIRFGATSVLPVPRGKHDD